MRLIFFDTETTGNTTDDRLIQLAIKERGVAEPLLNEFFKPPLPIPFESSMVHHISQKMVEGKPLFQESPFYQGARELFQSPEVVSVAHNAAFDVQMLKNEGIAVARSICTYKVVHELDTENRFAMYKLQYLRYALDIELEVHAHDALADVLVLEKLFLWELEEIKKRYQLDEATALQKMENISKAPLTYRMFDFGKYKGTSIETVAKNDPGYLSWLLEQKRQSEKDEIDWIHTLEQYLG